ncbi:hypothetical protein [Stenotrophomonas sp.]|uniref:hypothetical protein n=1 Tax=Stenotrophomonas sp. TaxID=69392 RepID=UPI0028A9388D|nr:hypothetical protein [Stenotrophomonas sp.]
MSRNVLIQARMEDQLRASFQAAAARECRPAAQVLRQLMEAYVAAQSEPDANDGRRRSTAVRRAAGAVVSLAPPPAPLTDGDDRDLDDVAQRQYGWHNNPFGAG